MGKAYCKKPRSFGAEAYIMLTILQFLYQIIYFYKIKTLTKKKIYNENKGLIHRLTEIKNTQQSTTDGPCYQKVT